MPSIPTLAFFGLVLAFTSAAAPTWGGSGNTCPSTSEVLNFDDAPGTPLGLNPLPAPYHGLFFQSFDTYQTGTNARPIAVPHSSPNGIYRSGIFPQSFGGGTPMITVNFAESNTTSFDLHSLFFGCLDATAGAPLACIVAIGGYQGFDNQVNNARKVCAQQLQYNPSTSLGPQQMTSSGPLNACFKDLAFVILQVSLQGEMAAANSDATLALDDVSVSTRKC